MSQPYAHTDLERLWRLVGRLEVILGLHETPEAKLDKIRAALAELTTTTPPAEPDVPWTVEADGSVDFHGFADDADDQPTPEGGAR